MDATLRWIFNRFIFPIFMRIALKKFGTTLTSRQAGSEAFKALQPQLRDIAGGEQVEVDFDGVLTLSPSWGDEFLTPLFQQFGERIILLPSDNLSVQATIRLLQEIHHKTFHAADSGTEGNEKMVKK